MDDALCIAGLFRGLVAWASEADDTSTEGPWHPLLRSLLEENYWRARRLGCAARFLGADGEELAAGDWLDRLGERIGPWRDEAAFEQARRILRDGSSGERQLDNYEQAIGAGLDPRQALAGVVDQVLKETSAACDPP